MNSKELLDKVVSILADAVNRRINIHYGDSQTAVCRSMDTQETLKYLIDRLHELSNELEKEDEEED